MSGNKTQPGGTQLAVPTAAGNVEEGRWRGVCGAVAGETGTACRHYARLVVAWIRNRKTI